MRGAAIGTNGVFSPGPPDGCNGTPGFGLSHHDRNGQTQITQDPGQVPGGGCQGREAGRRGKAWVLSSSHGVFPWPREEVISSSIFVRSGKYQDKGVKVVCTLQDQGSVSFVWGIILRAWAMDPCFSNGNGVNAGVAPDTEPRPWCPRCLGSCLSLCKVSLKSSLNARSLIMGRPMRRRLGDCATNPLPSCNSSMSLFQLSRLL